VVVGACVRAGVDRIQLRDRSLEGEEWLAFADAVSAAARRAAPGVEIVVNRRLDVALASGAQGVHLGFDALAIEDARALLGAGRLIGVSTHGVAEARAATPAGAAYVHLAPVFPPLSKAAERAPLGPAAVSEAARAGIAVIAQGGVEARHAAELVAAGAAGVAVTGAILGAEDPENETRRLREALDRAAQGGPAVRR